MTWKTFYNERIYSNKIKSEKSFIGAFRNIFPTGYVYFLVKNKIELTYAIILLYENIKYREWGLVIGQRC